MTRLDEIEARTVSAESFLGPVAAGDLRYLLDRVRELEADLRDRDKWLGVIAFMVNTDPERTGKPLDPTDHYRRTVMDISALLERAALRDDDA